MKYREEKIEPYTRMGYIISEFVLTQGAKEKTETEGVTYRRRTQGEEQRFGTQGNLQPLNTQGEQDRRNTWGARKRLAQLLTRGDRRRRIR